MFQKEIENSLIQAGFEDRYEDNTFYNGSLFITLDKTTISQITVNYTRKLTVLEIAYLCGFKHGRVSEIEEVKNFFKKYK